MSDEWNIKVLGSGKVVAIYIEAPNGDDAAKLYYGIAKDIRERQEIILNLVSEQLIITDSDGRGTTLQ